jgi:hypothetical protein
MDEKDRGENSYSLDDDVNRLVKQIVDAIAKAGDGEPDFGGLHIQKMRKIATVAMKADANNAERRFRPGSRLRTYTGVRDPDGALQDETYAGEAYLTNQSTIYRNVEPVRYAESDPDAARRGAPIKGRFEADGTFVEDSAGPEILYNEYATESAEHPRKKYGIEPKPGVWTQGLSRIPSYLAQIPPEKGEVLVRAPGGKLIAVNGGDFIVADMLGPKNISVQAIDRGNKERTYRSWEAGAP